MSPATSTPLQPPPGRPATLSIINTTTTITRLPASFLMQPPMGGLEHMPAIPCWSFLIESPTTGAKVLYDLGVPPDWDQEEEEQRGFAPAVVRRLRGMGWGIEVERGVREVLEGEGVSVEGGGVGSVIWSHWHWDHIGDPSVFPKETELVVGPGFKEAFAPYYPEVEDSPVQARYFEGRQLREINFDDTGLTIGAFRAMDFFGDGSFYLLDTPGHAVGHLGGLVRTTSNPDTFVMLGGDMCHHAGELRPNPSLPLPESVQLESLSKVFSGGVCPGAELESLQTSRGRKVDEPFFDPAQGLSIEESIRTLQKTYVPDAQDNVLFIFAHDQKIHGVVDFFPKTANDWKVKGWKSKLTWRFLEDFAVALEERKVKD